MREVDVILKIFRKVIFIGKTYQTQIIRCIEKVLLIHLQTCLEGIVKVKLVYVNCMMMWLSFHILFFYLFTSQYCNPLLLLTWLYRLDIYLFYSSAMLVSQCSIFLFSFYPFTSLHISLYSMVGNALSHLFLPSMQTFLNHRSVKVV